MCRHQHDRIDGLRLHSNILLLFSWCSYHSTYHLSTSTFYCKHKFILIVLYMCVVLQKIMQTWSLRGFLSSFTNNVTQYVCAFNKTKSTLIQTQKLIYDSFETCVMWTWMIDHPSRTFIQFCVCRCKCLHESCAHSWAFCQSICVLFLSILRCLLPSLLFSSFKLVLWEVLTRQDILLKEEEALK